MIEAVLFDNDGILVETEHLYFEASRDVLATRGIELDEGTFREISLRQGKSLMKLAEERGAGDEAIAGLLRERDLGYLVKLKRTNPAIDGVRDLIANLRSERRTAIVTSSLRHHFEAAHARTEMLELFELILTREDYGLAKPHPEPYLAAAERLGLAPEQCVVVEDSERGLASAVAAGMPCFAVPRGFTVGETFAGATAVLESLEQLPQAIRDLER